MEQADVTARVAALEHELAALKAQLASSGTAEASSRRDVFKKLAIGSHRAIQNKLSDFIEQCDRCGPVNVAWNSLPNKFEVVHKLILILQFL